MKQIITRYEKLNWTKAIIAGIIGTILFDIVGLIFAGQWWDIPEMLGAKMGLGFIYGIFGHYGNGILLAILYIAIAHLCNVLNHSLEIWVQIPLG